jgi:tRNA (guanine37-N1)-methyltransferase
MRIDVVTIFPEYLAPLTLSLVGRAAATGVLDLQVHDLRDFTDDRHRTVDDTPAGGGPGMVMRPEPWGRAIDHVATACGAASRWIVPTPAGRRFDQRLARELADEPRLAFACGRYEGIDQRVVDLLAERGAVDEVSIGDYVLAGGEVAAMVMVEAVARLRPGVLGNVQSLTQESHEDGLLEAASYTKPATWDGRDIPEVLRSGDHAAIAAWRRGQSLARTARNRPDLLTGLDPTQLDSDDLITLAQLGWTVADGRIRPEPPPVAD